MKKLFLLAGVTAMLAGCYPNSPTSTQQYDLVVSDYNPEYDFSSKTTFSIPSEVPIITGDNLSDPDGNGKPDFVSEPVSSQILNALAQNLVSYGWSQVDTSANPDVWILPVTFQTTTLIYYYDYWGYWGWYGGGYYGWYYPGYYPTYYSSYTTGSLFVSMVDPHEITASNQLPVEWSFIINGLLTGNSSSVTTRITQNVNQAFTQSPYLKH